MQRHKITRWHGREKKRSRLWKIERGSKSILERWNSHYLLVLPTDLTCWWLVGQAVSHSAYQASSCYLIEAMLYINQQRWQRRRKKERKTTRITQTHALIHVRASIALTTHTLSRFNSMAWIMMKESEKKRVRLKKKLKGKHQIEFWRKKERWKLTLEWI